MSKGLTRGDRPCWDRVMIIWAHGDRPCDRKSYDYDLGTWRSSMRNCLIYDSALTSSAQTHGDRPCRYMDLGVPHGSWTLDVFLRSIMYIQLREKLVLWGISLHNVILHWIPLYPSFLTIMCFIVGWKQLDIWLPLFDKLDLVCCWYCECLFMKVVIVENWVCSWGCANMLKMILMR